MLLIDPVRKVGADEEGGFGGNREVPGYFGAFSLYSSLVDSAITVTDQQDEQFTVTFQFETDMQVSEITATAIVDANTSVNLSNPAHSTSTGQTGTVHTYTWTRTVSRTPSEYRGYYRGTFDESIRIYVRVNDSDKSYVYGDTFENNTTQQLYYQVVRKQYAPFLAAPDAMIYTNYWPTPWGAYHRVGASSLDSDSGEWTIEEKYSAAIRSDRPSVDGGIDYGASIVGVSLNSDFPSADIHGQGGYWNVSKKIYNWSKYLRDHPNAHSGLAPGEPLETHDQVRFTYSNMYGSNSETRWQWLRIYPDIMAPTLSLSPNTNTITKKVLPGQTATYTVEATAQDDASIRSITASIVSSEGSGALTQIIASKPEDQPRVNVWEGGSGIWTTKRDFTFTVQAEGNLTASKTYTHTVSWTAEDHIGRQSSPRQIQFTTVATDETGPTVNGVTFNPSSLTLVTGDEDKPVEVTIDAADNYSADASLTSAVVAKIGQTTVASDSGDGLVRTLSFSHDSAGVQGGSNTVSFVTTVKDQFTNSTSKSYNFTLVADQKPTIDSVTTTNLTLAVGATSGTVTTTVNASDDIGLKKIRLLRGNVQIGSANVSGKSATQPFTEAFQRSDFTPSDTAYPGSYTIEVTDTADQKATTTADYEISVTRDTEKPVVVDLDQYYKVYDPVQFGYSGNWIALAHDATLDMSNLEGILLKYEAKATDNDQIASFVVSWPEDTEGFVQMPPAEIAEDGRSATLTLQRMVSRPGELTSRMLPPVMVSP